MIVHASTDTQLGLTCMAIPTWQVTFLCHLNLPSFRHVWRDRDERFKEVFNKSWANCYAWLTMTSSETEKAMWIRSSILQQSKFPAPAQKMTNACLIIVKTYRWKPNQIYSMTQCTILALIDYSNYKKLRSLNKICHESCTIFTL